MANFHQQPFDEGTITKLDLYQAYAKSWLPVFLSGSKAGSTVSIVDFFAGPGRDSEELWSNLVFGRVNQAAT